MPKYKYTAEHLEFLRKGYLSMKVSDLTKAFNDHFGLQKTESGIATALTRHKIKCGRAPEDRLVTRQRLLSEEQESFVREKYKSHTIKKVTKMLNKRFNTEFTYSQIKAFIFKHKIKSGRTGNFDKGHVPWNTGTKGLTSANKTSFKKGNIPARTRPLFSERIDKRDGCHLIKINTGFKRKHIWIWESIHGPVPEGKVLAFKDGNPENIDPENLMLITRAELLQLNKRQYKKMPAELKPIILAVSKLQAKISERRNNK